MNTLFPNKWLNNFIEHYNMIYIVSAQGFLTIFNLEKKIIEFDIQISNSQLIDITLSKDNLYIISVDGDIYVWNTKQNTLTNHINFPLQNFTSILCNNEILYIATMAGKILVLNPISITHKNTIFKIIHVCSSRIWKIVSHSNYLIGISNSNQIFVLNTEKNILSLYLCSDKSPLFTTCSYSEKDNVVIIGCSNGDMLTFNIETLITKSISTICNYTIKIKEYSCILSEFNFDSKIRVFLHDRINYYGRIIRILANEKIKFITSEIKTPQQENLILELSGWNRYPLIFWCGHYLGSGVLLTEMIKSGFLMINRGDK